jgi:hypothetical protein
MFRTASYCFILILTDRSEILWYFCIYSIFGDIVSNHTCIAIIFYQVHEIFCIISLLYSQAEVDDMVRKSTNLLLTRSFSGCLSSLFRKPSLALLQVIQIIIDTGYLENATVYLEEFVSNITGYVNT